MRFNQISSDEFHDFAKTMNERFGFGWNQSRYFQRMSIQDFNKKSRKETRRQMERLIEYKKCMRRI